MTLFCEYQKFSVQSYKEHFDRSWLVTAVVTVIISSAALCMLSDEIFDYQYVSQGKVDADTVDDGEDMQYCHVRKASM